MQTNSYYGCSGGCANCPRMRQCQAAAQAVQPAGETPLEAFLRANPDQGVLRVQAFRGPQSIPMENVRVTVSRQLGDEDHVFFEGTTDRSGLIDPIRLPAPSRSQSLSPGDANPSATYTVRAELPGYVPQETVVDIYQGIKTVQPVQLRME